MFDREVCISKIQKLLYLLEEDSSEMKLGLQGEMLEAYRSIVVSEIAILEDALILLKNAK